MSFFQSVIRISRLDRGIACSQLGPGIQCLHLVIPHSDRDLGMLQLEVDQVIPHSDRDLGMPQLDGI